MGDDEFLAINRDDLVDVARRCYDAELTRRQLAPETAPETEKEPEPDLPASVGVAVSGEELVQVGILADRDMAMYAQKMLQEADIPAVLAGGPTLAGNLGVGSIAVRVSASCAEAARDLLAGILTGSNKALVKTWFEQDWTPEGMDIADFRVTIDDLFGEESKVAVRMTVAGVNARTGRDIKFAGIAIVEVVDGAIGETWIKLDT
jgi:predicted ester cyclase